MKMFKIDVIGMMYERDINKINSTLLAIHGVKMADAVLINFKSVLTFKRKCRLYHYRKNNIDIERVKNIIRNEGYSAGLHISWIIS